MRFLILQHETDTPPGSTLEWLSLRRFDYEVFKSPELLNISPDLEHFDGLIICGGSMNVDQENQIPWLKNLKSLVKMAIQKNQKIFGICLGSQLLSEALGGSVTRMPHSEIGWHKVTLTTSPTQNELMAFHWHSYESTLPSGAEKLAFNEACQNQGFQFGQNILAYQFHPETEQVWINECLVDYVAKANDPYQQKPQDILNQNIHLNNLKQWYFSELDRFFVKY